MLNDVRRKKKKQQKRELRRAARAARAVLQWPLGNTAGLAVALAELAVAAEAIRVTRHGEARHMGM